VPQKLRWLMILWVILPKTYGIIIIHDENPCQSAEWINPFCLRTQKNFRKRSKNHQILKVRVLLLS
jgi:hypothetical protein